MPLLHPLPDQVVELIARRFRVLGDPTRIRLLERLLEGEAGVSELVSIAGTTQQNVSKHLSVLLLAGIVGRRKVGTSAYYWIADETVFTLCEQVCGVIEHQFAELGGLLVESRR
jgi:DNA-binding transcriptional ArsR family regulator